MRSFRRIVGVAAVTACLAWAGTPALADVTIPDASSPLTGVAFDPQSSRLFTVSDTDGTNILVTDTTGAKLGFVAFSAETQSVQGLAMYSGSLYVGDVGDPDGKRKKITIYKLSPEVGSQPYSAYDFSYPDGVSHDAKAMLVSGRGRIYIVTAGENPGIYYAELEPSRSGMNTLSRASDAPAGVTDAVFLADGTTIAMRTEGGVQVIDASTWETRATVTYEGAPGGESITTFTGDAMLVGAGPQLRQESVPTADGTITISPSGGASQPPSQDSAESAGSVSPTPQETAAQGPAEATTQPARGGTRLAVAAAAVLALALGALVFFRKK